MSAVEGRLTIHDLEVKRGARVLVSRLNLHARSGELIALRGSSGSGKTTILRAIAGLDPFDTGAIGNAILEQFPGSLLGHMAMASFFDRVAQPTDAAREHASAKAISDELLRSGDGTAARPYAAIATSDATGLMRQQGFIGLGSIYTDTTEGKLHLNLLVSQGPTKPLRTLVFDVTPTFSRLLEIQPPKDKKPASVPQLLFDLARRGDSGAMTTAATQLMREDVAQQTAAFRLLQQAVTDGNLYARLSLAQAYLNAYAGETDVQNGNLPNKMAYHYDHGKASINPVPT